MDQRMKRFAFFILAILAGVALGVIFGWEITPVRYTQTGPHTLRQDYKTDYVLMVAEVYHQEGDIAMALARMAFLGGDSPTTHTREAIAYAQEVHYSPGDLELMLTLSDDLQALGLEDG
ncbi:MAG: hypothetical protein ACOCYU_00670 [Brevefilum sp.]